MSLKICYHGTSEENAQSILENGFNPDSWFARHLEDAIGFGGPWVFQVCFEDHPILKEWQFHHLEPVPIEQIVGLTYYEITTKIDNTKLRDKIFESNDKGA